MPGSQDPNLWQLITDSRLFQTLATAFGIAIAFGYAIKRFLSRYTPQTRADENLKNNLETGVIRQIAHDLSELAKGQQDLRERVVRIETILERNKGA